KPAQVLALAHDRGRHAPGAFSVQFEEAILDMTAPGETPAEPQLAPKIDRQPARRSPLANWRQNIIYIGFACIFAIFALTLGDQGFLNPTNLLNIVRQSAMIAVMAVAMTFVLAAGEIDLSVGSLAGFSSVTTAMAIRA